MSMNMIEKYMALYIWLLEKCMALFIWLLINVSEYVGKYTALFLAEETSRAPNGVDVKRMKGHQD